MAMTIEMSIGKHITNPNVIDVAKRGSNFVRDTGHYVIITVDKN